MIEQALTQLLSVMARLRDPARGCPWDLRQDFKSIAVYTLEEAYEVVDAIERQDWLDLQEELGDLLLQVVFHTQMASEQQRFNFEDVVNTLTQKLIRRHPHVFEALSEPQRDSKTVQISWDAIKQQEKTLKALVKQSADTAQPTSVLDDVPIGLNALSRSQKLAKQAARIGFDWPDWPGAQAKIAEEVQELNEALASSDRAAIAHELGDLIQACANLARKLGMDAEQCLRQANGRFESRFRALEASVEAGQQLPLEELERRWQTVKRAQTLSK